MIFVYETAMHACVRHASARLASFIDQFVAFLVSTPTPTSL